MPEMMQILSCQKTLIFNCMMCFLIFQADLRFHILSVIFCSLTEFRENDFHMCWIIRRILDIFF